MHIIQRTYAYVQEIYFWEKKYFRLFIFFLGREGVRLLQQKFIYTFLTYQTDILKMIFLYLSYN